jgi:hypothetical protein
MLPSLIGSTKPNRYHDKLTAAHFETCGTFWSKCGHPGSERHRRSASKLSYDPNSLCPKQSRRLVLTG